MLANLTSLYVPNDEAQPPTKSSEWELKHMGAGVSVLNREVIQGFRDWPIWTVMGWDDIRQRYRRSVLGPFWITLSMGAFILVLSVIYSRLFNMELREYLPFLTAGYVLWGFISTSTNESCIVFHEGARLIKQIKLPFSVYVLRLIWRNLIVFFHTIIIYIPVALYFEIPLRPVMLFAIPGLLLVLWNQIWVTLVLGILSTRYRDIQPIVLTAVQLAMFATPIMWTANSLAGMKIVADANPIYHLLEVVRAPLLGTAPDPLSWVIVIATAVVGTLAACLLLIRTSHRIVFWV